MTKQLFKAETLESGEYYRINETKKILYWDGSQWMKPERDNRGRFSGLLSRLNHQPGNIKNVTLVTDEEIGKM